MRVELHPGLPGRRWACLRPVTGHDELALDAASADAGTSLVGRLICEPTGSPLEPATFRTFTMADRDRLLGAIYSVCFGDRIESIATCASCEQSFGLTISLAALLQHQMGRRPDDVIGPDADGFYARARGGRFRLPTIGDLAAAAQMPDADAWLQARCCHDVPPDAIDDVQAAMEMLAPILDLDIATRCPQCATTQTVRFSLPAFLVQALARERRFLTREVHRLAVAYGWRLDEILSLSRDDRRTFVRLAESELVREARA